MRILILSLMFMAMLADKSIAQENVSWEKDLKRLEEISNIKDKTETECREYFDILWSWTKKDHFYASTMLTLSVLPLMHMDSINMPGQDASNQSRFYNGLILAKQTFSLKADNPEQMAELKEILSYTQDESFWCIAFSKDKNASYNNCKRPENVTYTLPDFQTYRANIDKKLKSGAKPSCNTDGYDSRVIIP